MKKVYIESVKKWGISVGLPATTMIGLIFAYLVFLGAIEITGFSGDQVCAGTELDPCYAYINLTANEDIFIYPINYDPWGRNTFFEFTPGVKSWKLQRSWGAGWRDIPLNETCTGTWCGAPNNKGVKYSYVLRDGKDYQFRIVAMKNSPYETIKWSVNYDNREYLDPVWISPLNISDTTKELLQDVDYINIVKTADSFRVPNKDFTFYKSYNATEKRLLIEDSDFKTITKLKLISKQEEKIPVGDSVKFAEISPIEYENNLYDNITLYSIKDNYKKIEKVIIKKYRQEIITKECKTDINNKTKISSKICWNSTHVNWIEFSDISKIPNGSNIGLFTNTIEGEHIEWIIKKNGFDILEWASYLVTDLVSYYKLDENAASTTVDDAHGSNDGTASTNTNNLYDASGKINSAFDFGNKVQNINLNDAPWDDVFSGNFSINLWANFDTLTTFRDVIGKWYDGTRVFSITTAVDGSSYSKIGIKYEKSGSTGYIINSQTLSTGTFYMITATKNEDGIKFYVNANTPATTSDTFTTTNNVDLTIGATSFNTDGKIDEVAIWDRALTSTEVSDLYGDSGDGLAYPFSTDSCTYSSGNWEVDCSDNCTVETNMDLNGNNISLSGEGLFNIKADITEFGYIFKPDGCQINVYSQGGLIQ